MTEFLLGFVNVSIPYVSAFSIALYPMWKTRDVKARSVFIYLFSFTLYLCAGYFIVSRYWDMDFRTMQMFKLCAALPVFISRFLIFRKRVWQNVFFWATSAMYTTLTVGTGTFVSETWFTFADYPLLAANITGFAVMAITLPPLLYYLKRLYENPDMRQARIWRIIWILPLLYFGMYLLSSNPFDLSNFRGSVFVLSRLLTIVALIFTCYLLETALRQASENAALERMSQLKTEFMQNMSHEMKTPLTVISTDILNADTQLDFEMDKEDMRKSLRNAQREIMRMSRMVDSALNYSSIQEAKHGMKPLDTAMLLRVCTETYRPMVERHGNTLTLGIPESLPGVFGNADMLLQALSNLLSNANRHTQNGEISVSASSGNGVVTVTVRDNGEGVKPEIISQAFERGVSTVGGGLGLPICKSVIENHRGQITLESEYGKGTTVTFSLPVHTDEGGDNYE